MRESECRLCPRNCGTDREQAAGFCGSDNSIKVARAALHYWEEPVISGSKGSGAVFFCGCNLHCCFCQNDQISSGKGGKEISIEQLQDIFDKLVKQGAHNINLVTPTHYTRQIAQALEKKPAVPVVWNSSGYEKAETLELLEGKIDIYMPDLKYALAKPAEKYSSAPDYFETAQKAIREMYRQVGPAVIDEDGIMKKGVIIRHLVLPGNIENTKRVIDWVSKEFKPGEILFSLMSQYTPVKKYSYPELNRVITEEEYQEVCDYLYESGIEDGFMQELDSAEEFYIPSFDLTGII